MQPSRTIAPPAAIQSAAHRTRPGGHLLAASLMAVLAAAWPPGLVAQQSQAHSSMAQSSSSRASSLQARCQPEASGHSAPGCPPEPGKAQPSRPSLASRVLHSFSHLFSHKNPQVEPSQPADTHAQRSESSLGLSGMVRERAVLRDIHAQPPEPSLGPRVDIAAMAKSFSIPRAQLESRSLKVITSGQAFDFRQLDPNVAPRNLILARRTADYAQVVSESPEAYWGGAGVPISSPSFLSNGSSAGAVTSSGRLAAAGGSAAAPAPIATYSLPIYFRELTATSAPVSFQAVVMVLTGLRYQESSHHFVASIAVGLRNPARPADRSTLGNPLKLEILAAAADAVTPPEVEISKLGDPQTVQISAAAPTSPFLVAAKTLLDEGDKIEIPVEKVPVIVRPVRAVIDGWGLAKTSLQIEVPGLQQAGTHMISLSTDRGQIVPTPVLLDAQGRATAELRSDGTGTATITAAGGPFRPGTATVRFAFPLDFLIATVLGAVTGWLVKKRARDLTLRSCIVAVASACILGTAYAIGIHWLEWAPDASVGEGLSFFVAAMGAYSGLKALTTYEEGREGEEEEAEDEPGRA